jgi:hypothetical protein
VSGVAIAILVLSVLDLAGLVAIFVFAERMAVRGRLLASRHLDHEFKRRMQTARGVRQVALGGFGFLAVQGVFYLLRGRHLAGEGIGLAVILLLLEFFFLATFLSPNFWPVPGSEAAADADRLAHSEPKPAPSARERRTRLVVSGVFLVIGAVLLAFNHDFSGTSYPAGARGVAKRIADAKIGCTTTTRTIIATSQAQDNAEESFTCPGGILILTFGDHYFRDGFFKEHPAPAGRTVMKGLTAVECASPGQAASVRTALGGNSRVT